MRGIKSRVLHKIAKISHPNSLRTNIHRLRGVEIGKGVFIGEGVHLDDSAPDLIKIADNVQIGVRSVIMPGVKIGEGSIVGAGAVVCKNIPEHSLAVGVPAEVVKKFDK